MIKEFIEWIFFPWHIQRLLIDIAPFSGGMYVYSNVVSGIDYDMIWFQF